MAGGVVYLVALGVDTVTVSTGTSVTLTADAVVTFVSGGGVAIVSRLVVAAWLVIVKR